MDMELDDSTPVSFAVARRRARDDREDADSENGGASSSNALARTGTVTGRSAAALPAAPLKSGRQAASPVGGRSRAPTSLRSAFEAGGLKGLDAKEDDSALQRRLEESEREISSLRRQNATLEAEARQLRANADDVIAGNEDLKSQVTQLRLEYRYLEEETEQERMDAAMSVNTLESEKAGVERNLRLCQEELVAATRALETSREEAARLKRELDAAACTEARLREMGPAELRALARSCSERSAKALALAEEKEAEASACEICRDARKRSLLVPCLHMTCGECAAKLSTCPFCNARVESRKALDI
eukprot:tig00020911_g15733.t1